LCTDPDCFAEKTAAHSKKAKQKAEERGQTVISGAEAKSIMPNSYGKLKGGYANVDESMWVGGTETSYRKLLGKQLPKSVMLESPFEPGKLITIAKIDELEDLVTEVAGSGKTEASISAKQKAKEKQQEQAAAVEKLFRRELFIAIRDAGRIEQAPINEQEVAALLFRNSPNTEDSFIRKLYGWTGPEFESGTWDGKYVSSGTRITEAIRQMSSEEARQLIRDMTFIRELEVSTYSYSKTDAPSLMLAAAASLGINADDIKATLVKEAKQKADEKAAKKAKAAAKAKKSAPAQVSLPEVPQAQETRTTVRSAPAATSPIVQYRNPNAPGQAWTGRGKQPKWVSEWVQSGKSLDSLRVDTAPAASLEIQPASAWPFPLSSNGQRDQVEPAAAEAAS
jgi:DNA-binding protein H-NS